MRVRAAAQVVEDADARGPDRHVGEPVPPGAPEGVGDDHADVHAQRVAEPLADAPRGGVGVLGEQQHGPGRRVGGVDARRRHDQALTVLDDAQRAASGHHPHRLRVDRGLPVGGLDDAALGLGHDLGRDEQHVSVGQPGLGRRDQLGQVVAGPHLGQPRQGPHPVAVPAAASAVARLVAHASRTSSASVSASRAICAVASRSVIISGTARQRIPAAFTRVTESASTVSTSQPSSSPEP